jgi:hypothetical protein
MPQPRIGSWSILTNYARRLKAFFGLWKRPGARTESLLPFEPMLLVIFGAGASYDSVSHLPPPGSGRPPLGNKLFEDRTIFVNAMKRFPECIPLVPTLRGKGVQVEKELARIKEQTKTYPRAFSELTAIRFYLHYALWECQRDWHRSHNGITNYAALLRELDRWRVETGDI